MLHFLTNQIVEILEKAIYLLSPGFPVGFVFLCGRETWTTLPPKLMFATPVRKEENSYEVEYRIE